MNILKRLSIGTISLMALLMTVGPALSVGARGSDSTETTNTSGSSNTSTPEQHSETETTPEDHTATASNDSTETEKSGSEKSTSEKKSHSKNVKLKSCQKHETVINNILSRISDRGQKQLNLFTGIANKTEEFYATKGRTLANYDALVEDVSAKQALAQEAVDSIKTTSVTFKCDGTNPKGVASSFKEALKSEIAALKEYKIAVKNLIKGVKSVQSTETSTDNTTESN